MKIQSYKKGLKNVFLFQFMEILVCKLINYKIHYISYINYCQDFIIKYKFDFKNINWFFSLYNIISFNIYYVKAKIYKKYNQITYCMIIVFFDRCFCIVVFGNLKKETEFIAILSIYFKKIFVQNHTNVILFKK